MNLNTRREVIAGVTGALLRIQGKEKPGKVYLRLILTKP